MFAGGCAQPIKRRAALKQNPGRRKRRGSTGVVTSRVCDYNQARAGRYLLHVQPAAAARSASLRRWRKIVHTMGADMTSQQQQRNTVANIKQRVQTHALEQKRYSASAAFCAASATLRRISA
jgi:hypothetical protein